MASSRKSRSGSFGSLASKPKDVLREFVRPGDHLIVALSGGLDSVVLLDLLIPLSSRMSFSLSAVHVNHGISANADEWSRFCENLCRSSGIPLHIARLNIRREPGLSLEAAARDARYQVFGKLKVDYVVLAQHLDDQAETLLLQLLRGAGVKGLGAMPVVRNLEAGFGRQQILRSGLSIPYVGPLILRPLLEVPRREIEKYARARALQWITDESNEDVSFDRNFLRHEIFPLLEKRFPSYRTTFLRTSRHLAEASTLLGELAAVDAEQCIVPGKLHIEDLRKLSFPRAKNLLRYTLAQQGVILPSATKLDEILRQLLSSHTGAKIHVVFGAAEIRCFKGLVYVRSMGRRPQEPLEADWQVAWNGEKRLVIPELGGTLVFRAHESEGISLQKISAQPVTIRPRQGGERLRPDCKRPRRSLKNLLREASLPPWERQSLPLMFSGEHLVCVPGIGVDCEFQAGEEEPGLVLEWISALQEEQNGKEGGSGAKLHR